MLARQTALYLPAQVLAPLVQLVSVLVWARLLNPEDVGIVTLTIAAQEISFAAIFGWWSHYLLRFYDRGAAHKPALLQTELFVLASVIFMQAAFFMPLLSRLAGGAGSSLWWFGMGFVTTRSICAYYGERARADHDVLTYSAAQLIGPLGGFAASTGILYSGRADAEVVFGSFFVFQLLSAGICAARFGIGSIGAPSREIITAAVRFGMPVAASGLLSLVALNAPRFVVQEMGGLTAAGMFAVGYGLGVRVASVVVMAVTAGAYPLVLKALRSGGIEAALLQLSRNTVLVALVVIPAGFGVIALSPMLVELLVPTAYKQVTLAVLPLAAFGGVIRALRVHTTDQIYLVIGKPLSATLQSCADVVIVLASSILGMRYCGEVGASIGPAVSGSVIIILSGRDAVRRGFQFSWRELSRILLASAIMASVLLLVTTPPTIIGLLMEVALGVTVFASALLVLLPREAKLWISRARAGASRR
jgi:O-antigen/teichoic acid export membrane protein